MKTNELESGHLEWLEAHTLETLHPSHTVEDHFLQFQSKTTVLLETKTEGACRGR